MEGMSLNCTVVYNEPLLLCDLFYHKALSRSDPQSLHMKVGAVILPSQGGLGETTMHTATHSDSCSNCCCLL